MFDALIESLDDNALPPMGARVVVGVSGGADSTLAALIAAQLANEKCWEVLLAHFRHGAGPADDEALATVNKLAEDHDLLILVSDFQEGSELVRPDDSQQMAWRRMRFAWFASLFGESDDDQALILGHNADDQAETVLMRALKGRWLQGLAGIPESRRLEGRAEVQVFRPLLSVSAAAIRTALRAATIVYCEDPANLEERYERVGLRRHLLNEAKISFGNDVLTALAALSAQAEDLAEAERWMLPFLKERVDLREEVEDGYVLNLESELPIFCWRTLLRQVLLDLGLTTREATMARVERLRMVEMTKGALELGAGICYRRVHNQLRIWRE